MTISHAAQIWHALDLYEDRRELEDRTFAQARECLERACFEWDEFVAGVVACWLAHSAGEVGRP